LVFSLDGDRACRGIVFECEEIKREIPG